MALKESEAIVLRTYPLREADLLVTLFTRLEGKVRGVARSAKKSRRRFGGELRSLPGGSGQAAPDSTQPTVDGPGGVSLNVHSTEVGGATGSQMSAQISSSRYS